MLDPVLVFAVEMALGNNSGDFFRLYNYYYATEGNGVIGLFNCLFFYVHSFPCLHPPASFSPCFGMPL